jgi:hypothetical protein
VMQRASAADELQLGEGGFGLWRLAVRYVAPAAITLIALSLTGLLPF